MGSPSASLWPTPPLCDYERGLAPQREQRPESDLPSADAQTYMLVGLRRSLARVVTGNGASTPKEALEIAHWHDLDLPAD